LMPLTASLEPSVGMRMCLNMDWLYRSDWQAAQ
jgi:hypothetical protein